jgi:hypothetical protein
MAYHHIAGRMNVERYYGFDIDQQMRKHNERRWIAQRQRKSRDRCANLCGVFTNSEKSKSLPTTTWITEYLDSTFPNATQAGERLAIW